MKKTILSLTIALVAFSASAQIEKGTIMVSGASSFDFSSYNQDFGDFSEFNLGLKGGYFFMDNLTVGLNLRYYKHSEAVDAWTGIGLFGRYYINGKIILGAGFTSNKSGSYSASEIPLEAGYAIFAGKAVAIEPALNISMFGGDDDGSAVGLRVGISVYLGRGD